ncbi:MAG: RsmE family RNA methyltransferase, partial [Myxococcota bacterium]
LGPLNVVHVAQLTRSTAGESSLELGLLVGLPKGERWEWIIQKCTELGAHWIQPLYTERGDVTIPDTRLDRRLERWRRIAAEATRQCRRSQACHIVPPQSLSEALQALQEPSSLELRVVAAVSSPGGAADSLMGYMTTCAGASIRRATVLVGPEGGLTDAEVKAAMAATFTPVKLGPRVLRTETAAVAACTLLQAVWGDMR